MKWISLVNGCDSREVKGKRSVGMEWISVKDIPPRDREELLMTYNDLVMEGEFANGKFYHPSGCAHMPGYCKCDEQEGITHWMPLPAPPKTEET